MSKIIHLRDEVIDVLDTFRESIGKKHPSLVNRKTGKASYSVVIEKALRKAGFWNKNNKMNINAK